MISVILARTGQPRWCEISFSPPASAETFLQLYPETRFVCLHRSCPNVIQSWIQANPWGLAGTSIGPFVAAYPGNNAAAIAAYWVEYTEQSLQFEQGHPVACRRVRHEDLSARSSDLAGIFEFLGLSWEDALPGVLPRDEAEPAGGNSEMDRTVLPHLIPRPLAERVNDLQACLGYQPLAP